MEETFETMISTPQVSGAVKNIPIIGISDSFVYNLLKLKDGKNGHGERRIYTGGDNSINDYICTKPWKLSYPDNYLTEITPILTNPLLFTQKCDNRLEIVSEYIQHCNEKFIDVIQQNGKNDGKRCYVGPKKTDKKNINLYDTFRKTLIPKEYSIKLLEEKEYFICNIISNNAIDQVKSKSSSNVSIEYLNFLSKDLSIEIQHEHNGGEFQLRNPKNGYFWPVDGYHNCNIHKCQGTETTPCQYNKHVWEFQGDYFHGNPLKYSSADTFHNISYDAKHIKDAEKKKYYELCGYIVVCKWESEWTTDKIKMRKEGKTWW
jgi:hypothetical protein